MWNPKCGTQKVMIFSSFYQSIQAPLLLHDKRGFLYLPSNNRQWLCWWGPPWGSCGLREGSLIFPAHQEEGRDVKEPVTEYQYRVMQAFVSRVCVCVCSGKCTNEPDDPNFPRSRSQIPAQLLAFPVKQTETPSAEKVVSPPKTRKILTRMKQINVSITAYASFTSPHTAWKTHNKTLSVSVGELRRAHR